ncbi:uncharacterized protein [Diadema antillarum]|uniref:uncharacterized protein isoform X2 n=1 Tax=Diadema antillarum TaxID=105358 RepID=UPI003A87A07D
MSNRRSQIVTMGFPDRGEENLMRQTSRCKNFQPNMFTKTKCQNCFRTREAHDLGDDDGSNKPKKAIQYGYLFVAPGIDFDNPMSRNRKWQRRCFILYENGELCYALDYDPNTIPQGVVDMYQCTKVFAADKLTGHPFSMGVATPDETTYIRAETREEKDSWYMTLIEYPEINKENERQKKRKRGVFPMVGPKDSDSPQKIEEAEAKPDVPPSNDDPASKLSEMDHDLAVESRDEPSDILTTTARDTTDILTATSKAARKEKSNLRRSHSALEQRPEKYDKRQVSRKPPTGMDPTSSSTERHREDRLVRRHTASGRTESKAYSKSEGLEGKGDSTKRPLSDGSSYVYSGSSSLRSRPSESGLADLERELGTTDPSTKSQRESLPAHSSTVETSLHRNNNNVYKDLSPRSSPTHQASSSRKSSTSERSMSPTDSQSTTESLTKKSQPSKADTNSQNLLSQEELQRMDVPKRGRFRLNKDLIQGETQSPSKRTIERRRHAQERRNRHTLDGSTVPFPISERKSKSSESPPRLKRSNSDPNLADNEDVKRKEIAETFPGLLHLKNGWLMMMVSDQEEWSKFWFVLRDNKLSFFKDSSDESPSNLAGAVDLAECKEATETTASRNYGFQVKMEDGRVHRLGAMTSGIRTNWVHAINKAIATAQQQASPDAPIGDLKKADQPVKQSATPDVIPTPAPKQDQPDSSSSTVDLTARHRKNSTDSRASGTTSPTERDPVFQERQGSIRSKERRSRRGSRGDDLKSQKRSSSRSSVNGRSSSTSSEIFETPPNTPVPVELQIEEPVRTSLGSQTRSERTSGSEGLGLVEEPTVEVQKIEADSLKPDQPVVDNIQTENIQSRTNLGGVRKTPSPDNENEQKALVSQLETVAKKLSQVELHNQTLQMEVKQARNASELLKHEKEDLQEKLQNSTSSLEKRSKECETLQSRFEKLVGDLQESETEVSKARSSLKTERDKALTMIERLSQQIEVLETEKKESKERMKKWEADSGSQQKHMRQLEKNQEESQEIIKKLIAKMEGYKQRLEAKGDEGSSSQTQRLQELQEVNKQLQVRLEETEQQLEAKKETTQSAPNVETESELESELADLRMELSEKDEQIEQLSEQLEEEYSERSELQKKYDNLCTESAQFILEGQGDKAATSPVGELEEKLHKAVAQVETLNTQLNNESSQRKQAEDKLSGELSEKQKLERTIHELEEQFRSVAEKSEEPHAQEDVKNLMELLQGKNKEVEKLQSEVKRVDKDRLSLLEQSSKLQVDIDTMKKQLKQSEDSKSTLEGDLECVLQSKLDLEESAKQTATELETVKSELEILRQASQNAASAATEASKLEAVQKENLLVKAQVEKVQKIYTDDMFKKEQLLAEEQEKRMELERKLITQQSRATQREEEIAKQEREGGEKLLAMTQQVEQLGQKAERGEKELKRLRAELKTSQDNYDALELKHMQSIEESKQQQKSQQEQLELMGRRIQDLTSKLGSAERKVRDLASAEAGWSSFGGGGNSSVHRVHLGAESGTTCISPSSGIHSQLKEVEEVLGSAECRIQRQQQKASALKGKIESVEKHMEAIEQASPSSNLSSVDHDVSVNSSSSPSSHSSINQLAGVTTPAPKQADISDTSDSSDCPSSDGADGSSKIKILESRLAEMEQKLKQVTHRLVDVTTRELEKRKAYQAKCIAENKLKDQVRGLQREVLALRQQMEKQQQGDEMLQAQQRSHRKALDDMQRSHQHELEKREEVHKKEKEDEDKAVTTAISAVKRAYEAELEKERRLSGESSPKEVESIMKRHREVVDQMNKDWLILSHKFSEQCKENSTLNKALRAMQRSQREAYERLQRAQVENRQRVDSLGQELARLEGMVQGGDTEAGGGGSGGEGDESDEEEEESSEEVKLMQVNLKLRELELEFAQEEIENLRRAKEEASASLKSGAEQPGAGDIAHRGSLASIQTESDGSTRPKSRRSLSDLTTRFYKSKKSDKK